MSKIKDRCSKINNVKQHSLVTNYRKAEKIRNKVIEKYFSDK